MGCKIDVSNPIWVRLLGRSQLSNPSDLPCSWSSVEFQGHTGQKIAHFDLNWALLDCNSSLNAGSQIMFLALGLYSWVSGHHDQSTRQSAQAVSSTLFHCLCWRPWRISCLRRTRLSQSGFFQQWKHGWFKLLNQHQTMLHHFFTFWTLSCLSHLL